MDAASSAGTADLTAARLFQRELRRWRTRRGLTQRALADRVRFSRETVAAVEAGRRYGSQELAIRCDQVLGTGGRLAELWPRVAEEQLAADGRRGPRPAGAERLRAPGSAADPEARERRAVVEAIDELRELIDQMLRVHFPAAEERPLVAGSEQRAPTAERALPSAPSPPPAAHRPARLPCPAEPGAGRESRVDRPGRTVAAAESSADRRTRAVAAWPAVESRRGRTGATRWQR
ncbi:helix-turn-helix transcriptional regulator [Micromonospora sp. HM5-17]|jgi:transcriptional regulator with XRE-family HTH domain|uniref:helix-turn-helix transcriptional regulator n=1 Tax=Micromonospora sp. HM5-17 TaxID=2487710 RepID=UPI000F47FA25|nr:helix-turn-helix transcriptional regulator [Micromonospora sp. HM5-17]ROT28267.1 XRE family transcriptional regulator [Micromonospora sp. HM5-17]